MRQHHIRTAATSLAVLAATGGMAADISYKNHLATKDTSIVIAARDGGVDLGRLASRAGAPNWAAPTGSRTLFVPVGSVDGKKVALKWVLKSRTATPKRIVYTFECASPPMVARSEWKASRDTGPIQHTLTLENRGSRPVTLPPQKSLVWSFFPRPGHAVESSWVVKSAGKPGLTGMHTRPIGLGFSQHLVAMPNSSTVQPGENEPLPWVTVYDASAKSGWYAGILPSNRVTLEMFTGTKKRIWTKLGLAPAAKGAPGSSIVVMPGGAYSLPTVYVGCYEGTVEAGCDQINQWMDAGGLNVAAN